MENHKLQENALWQIYLVQKSTGAVIGNWLAIGKTKIEALKAAGIYAKIKAVSNDVDVYMRSVGFPIPAITLSGFVADKTNNKTAELSTFAVSDKIEQLEVKAKVEKI